ncbi:hypothetical protein B0H11DRAFT_1884695 [Mycena galericulata]|nr:hypothetical protein B0H11DRAFT_1884695 [Mycena galericulata]
MLCASCEHPLPPSDALPTPTQFQELLELLRSNHFRVQATLQEMLDARSRLQAYVDGFRVAVSPVRRLPPEILCEIFGMFSSSSLFTHHSPREEMENLAKSELLQISQVCAHWHRLIMGTPSLWSDVAIDPEEWPRDPTNCDRFLNLIRVALQRSAPSPLHLRMRLYDLPPSVPRSILTSLAEYSRRWEQLTLYVSPSELAAISRIKGTLDSLKDLSLVVLSSDPPPDNSIDIFEWAPRLTHANLSAPSVGCKRLPWHQLQSLTYYGSNPQDIAASLALMAYLSGPRTTFKLRRFSACHVEIPLSLSPITSGVFSFTIELWTKSNPQLAVQVLGEILDCLTSPRLQQLCVRAEVSRRHLILWPVNQFESLSLRSSFCDTLRILEISHVSITEDELLRSLASLAALDHLAISDQRIINDIPHPALVLITDTLLMRLAWKPNPVRCLVPRLQHLHCTSFFTFTPRVYLDLIASRTTLPTAPVFQAVLSRLANGDTAQEFDPEVHQRLVELVEEGQLEFILEE